jgi:iron complex outermembrane receptor protein
MAHMFRASIGLVSLSVLLLAAPAAAQQQTAPQPTTSQPNADDEGILRTKLPTVTVTATKEPADVQRVPVSVTAVSGRTLADSGARIVSDAAIFAPNTFFSEFTARKLSTARFRGIGSSPANPAITTYIDGVPQLNTNSSSLELLDVGQVEFVRGPQSALFGRNTLGGLVSIATARPSTSRWNGSLSAPFGNVSSWGLRGNASGPITDKLSAGFAFAHMERDGYTVNDLTGNTIDDRSAFTAKGQVLWAPAENWEARVIVSGERARDGDYALNDLATIRRTPFHSSVNFEGFTDRDIFSTAIQTRRTGGPLVFSTTTGFVKWKTQDVTDLDYTPLPLVTRDNTEEDFQFTQEVRVASAENAALRLSDALALRWQAGVFLFTQGYDQDAVNNFAPGLISQQLPFPISQHSPQSELDDFGLGFFGQGVFTLNQKLDFTAGARVDYENKSATLNTFFDPAIAPPSSVDEDASFTEVSPQFAVAYRLQPEHTVYASVSRGFKAGGFNAASLPGSEAYGEEHTWNLEGGVKTTWAEGRVSANAAVFYIDWDDLQLNVPDPFVPAQFYIANVGSAKSRGVELELNARAAPGVDLFGGIGYTHARFGDNSLSSGVDVSGNKLPSTPDYTTMFGGQYSRALSSSLTMYGRAEAVFYGAFQYDDQNREGQDAYSLANFRGGVRGKFFFADLWIRNAFDTRYIPIAFSYASFAPSGFVGEMGAPRTFGLTAGVTF